MLLGHGRRGWGENTMGLGWGLWISGVRSMILMVVILMVKWRGGVIVGHWVNCLHWDDFCSL